MEETARILCLIVLSGLLIALIKGGWTGPGGAQAWFKAKFLGKVAGA